MSNASRVSKHAEKHRPWWHPNGPGEDPLDLPVFLAVTLSPVGEDLTTGIKWTLTVNEDEGIAGLRLVTFSASLHVPSSSGSVEVVITNDTGPTNVLSTALTIDSGDKRSDTAGTTVVVDPAESLVVLDDSWTVEVTDAGSGAQELAVKLRFE